MLTSTVLISASAPWLLPVKLVELIVPSMAALSAAIGLSAEYVGKTAVSRGKEVAAVTLQAAAESEAVLAQAERAKAVVPLCVGLSATASAFALLAPELVAELGTKLGLQIVTEVAPRPSSPHLTPALILVLLPRPPSSPSPSILGLAFALAPPPLSPTPSPSPPPPSPSAQVYLICPLLAAIAAAVASLATAECAELASAAAGLGARRFASSGQISRTWLSATEQARRTRCSSSTCCSTVVAHAVTCTLRATWCITWCITCCVCCVTDRTLLGEDDHQVALLRWLRAARAHPGRARARHPLVQSHRGRRRRRRADGILPRQSRVRP